MSQSNVHLRSRKSIFSCSFQLCTTSFISSCFCFGWIGWFYASSTVELFNGKFSLFFRAIMFSSNPFLFNVNLLAVIHLQVFLSNTNDFMVVIWFLVFIILINFSLFFSFFNNFLLSFAKISEMIFIAQNIRLLVGWLFGFYGISTFVGYLMPNPFLYKWSVQFQAIQFSMSTQFNCHKHFHFKLFSWVKILIQPIQFSISIDFVYR